MKASFNASSITKLVFEHIEKAVLGLAGLFVLFLVYGGIAKSGGLDWEPSKLETEAASADKALDGRTGEPLGPDQSAEDVQRLRKALAVSLTKVENAGYDHERPWLPSAIGESVKRDIPPLFTVEGLRATAGWGAVQMVSPTKAKAAAGDPLARRGSSIGQRWVVLTAVIPLAKQLDAYRQAFKDSYKDPTRDMPSYIYYRVERVEVDASGSATELQWTRLNVGYNSGSFAQTLHWTAKQPEIVHRLFLLPPVDIPMAFPLPPTIDHQWGAEIAHEPDIPFYYEAKLAPTIEEPPGLDGADDPGVDEPGAMRPGGVRGYQGTPGGGMMGAEMEGMEDDLEMGADMGMPGGFSPRMRLGGEPINVRLFRFFDFTVVPGKHYRYRVRLLVTNPNQDIPPEHLARPELRDAKFLETEFSDPTDMVTIPLDSRLLCVSVKSSANPSVEPSAHMMSIHFDPATGDQSAAEHEKLSRGQLANFFGIPIEIASAADASSLGPDMMPGEMDEAELVDAEEGGGRQPPRGRRRNRRREAEEVELVDHVTQHIVLDFHGGQRLDRDLTRPCSVLLLDPSGQLVVRSDLDDQEEYLTYHVPEEEPRDEPEERMMEGMGMEDMMGEPEEQ